MPTRRWQGGTPCRWLTCSRPSRPVKCHARCCPQRGVERCGVQIGVGGEHDEHGGQPRRQHASALRHAADGPAVPDDRGLLGDGVVVVMMTPSGPPAGLSARRRLSPHRTAAHPWAAGCRSGQSSRRRRRWRRGRAPRRLPLLLEKIMVIQLLK